MRSACPGKREVAEDTGMNGWWSTVPELMPYQVQGIQCWEYGYLHGFQPDTSIQSIWGTIFPAATVKRAILHLRAAPEA